MLVGLYLRNMGPQSSRETVLACARAAEDAGVDDLWVADHVAIPPDDAEGTDHSWGFTTEDTEGTEHAWGFTTEDTET